MDKRKVLFEKVLEKSCTDGLSLYVLCCVDSLASMVGLDDEHY